MGGQALNSGWAVVMWVGERGWRGTVGSAAAGRPVVRGLFGMRGRLPGRCEGALRAASRCWAGALPRSESACQPVRRALASHRRHRMSPARPPVPC